MRTVADVSAVADPETGVAVYDTYQAGGWDVFGGTSASSPIIAGVFADAGTPGRRHLPVELPVRERRRPERRHHRQQRLLLARPTCAPPGAGYDGPTGLGTPDGLAAFTTGPHGTVTGTVTDASTSTAIAGATVTIGDRRRDRPTPPATTRCPSRSAPTT